MPSSVIAAIRYEPDHARLTVTFTSGRVYEYYMVAPDAAAAFRSSASKGAHFNAHIRDRYTCRDVTPARTR